MKNVDKLLQTQTPTPKRQLRSDFTSNIITALESRPPKLGLFQRWEHTYMKSRFLPKPALAALAIVIALGLGTGAYAALNWFGTTVETSNKDSVVVVSNKDCPSRVSNSLLPGWTPKSDSETSYRILKPELITADDIRSSQLVYCEHQAIDAISAHYFPAQYDYKSYGDTMEKDGFYQPFSNYGTVASVGTDSITVNDVHINNTPHTQEHTTVTLHVQPSTKIVDKGTPSNLAGLAVGDQVYFTFHDVAPAGASKKLTLDTPGKEGSKLLVVAKTQYDYRLMDKFMLAGIDKAYEFIKTNDPNMGG